MSDSTIAQVHSDASDLTGDLFSPEESNAYFSSLLAKRTKADESMTRTQGKYLAWLVCSLYPEWDEERVMAAIEHAVASHTGKGAAAITLALLAWAADGTNLSPGGVSVPGRHWERARAFLDVSSPSPASRISHTAN